MTHASIQSEAFPAGAGPMPTVPGVEIEHEFYDLPAGRFHVARAGDRSLPAIMLVHGWPQHWWSWRGVIAELSKEAHLIMPDLRGSGWSAVPEGMNAYRKTEMGNDLRLLLRAMGIDRIAVGAHDWGGFASQLLALSSPEVVSRLLVLSIPPVMPVRRPPIRSALRMTYTFGLAAPFSNRVLARDPSVIAKGMRSDVRQRDAFTREDATVFAEPFRDPARAKAAQGIYRSLLLHDVWSLAKNLRGAKFQMPVRFVLSAHDAYVPPEFAEAALRTGREVEAFVQDRTGHFLPDEDPAYTADQIREWLLPVAQPL